MIKQIEQIRRLLRHKKGTQIPWITQILTVDSWQLTIDSWAGAVFHIAAQEINQKNTNLGAKPWNGRAIQGSVVVFIHEDCLAAS